MITAAILPRAGRFLVCRVDDWGTTTVDTDCLHPATARRECARLARELEAAQTVRPNPRALVPGFYTDADGQGVLFA